MNDIQEFLESGIKFFSNYNKAMKNYDDYFKAVGDCDKATQDILHNFELANLDRNSKNKNTNKLINIRKDRRYYKDKIEAIDSIKSVLDDYEGVNFIKIFNQLLNAFGNARSKYNSRADRKYKPKFITDIELVDQQKDQENQ